MDIQQFAKQITPLRKNLYRYALKMLCNDADAEDNVQETFLRVWSMGQKIDAYSNLGGLAMQINKNLCLDKLRARKHKLSEDYLVHHTNGQNVHNELEVKQTVGIIHDLILNLPTLQQIIIRMRDVEGYEIDEIASLTLSKASAVRVNLSRARLSVRERYFKLTNAE